MSMTLPQIIITIAICALSTALTRFLPFLLFPAGKKLPPAISYLSQVLPYAVIGLLVVYCLKDISLLNPLRALPEALSVAVVAAMHVWKRNVFLSIATGTALYMVIIGLL